MKSKLFVKVCFIAVLSGVYGTALAQNVNNENTDDHSSSAERRATLAKLTEQLYELESTYNAFNPAIGEIAFDMGNLQLTQGLFEDAIVSFRRYMHVLRINEGLRTEKQIPALEKIIDAHYQLGDPSSAGHALTQLYGMYDDSVVALSNNVDDLIGAGEWHLSLVDVSLKEYQIYHLFLAHSAFRRASEIRLIDQHIYTPKLYTTLCSINYKIAELAQEDRDILNSTQGVTSYKQGVAVLETALTHVEDIPDPSSKIDVLMQLGDWDKRFNRIRGAKDYYLQAYEESKALPTSHPFHSVFDLPQVAYDFEISDENNDETEVLSYHEVTVNLDISKWGDAYGANVVVESLTEEEQNNRKLKRAATRKGNSLTFRPRIVDGEFVATKNFIHTIDVAVR